MVCKCVRMTSASEGHQAKNRRRLENKRGKHVSPLIPPQTSAYGLGGRIKQ